jgi:hypothetical protein
VEGLSDLILETISKKSFGPTRQRRTSLCVGSSFQLLGILDGGEADETRDNESPKELLNFF